MPRLGVDITPKTDFLLAAVNWKLSLTSPLRRNAGLTFHSAASGKEEGPINKIA